MKSKLPVIYELVCWAMLATALVPIYSSSSKYQGWGGDYAGYLCETRNIANGILLATTNYLYNPGYAELAPPAYPVGFPLLLLPVYASFGLDMLAYTHFMGILWWVVGVLVFLILKRYFSIWVALVASLLFIYHPIFFFERNGVLSDYPFAICFLAATYFYLRGMPERSLKNALLLGFFAGFAWLTRTIGFVIPVAIAIHLGWELYKQRANNSQPAKSWLMYIGTIAGLAIAIQLIFHGILYPLPSNGSYFDQLDANNLTKSFGANLTEYTKVILQYFQLNGDLWHIYRYKNTDAAASLGGAIALGLTFIGLARGKNNEERFFVVLMLTYLAVILCWPSFQGYRFLLPIIPFLLYFLLKAIQHIETSSSWGTAFKWGLVPLLLVGEYNRIDTHIYNYSQIDEIGSPEWKDNQAAYRYAKDSIPAGAVFGYHHPLIFALYADKPAVRWSKNGSPQEIKTDFEKFNVGYLLLNDWLVAADQPLQNYLKENANQLDTVWHNERNVLYKLK